MKHTATLVADRHEGMRSMLCVLPRCTAVVPDEHNKAAMPTDMVQVQ